jgi:hypothetical protein
VIVNIRELLLIEDSISPLRFAKDGFVKFTKANSTSTARPRLRCGHRLPISRGMEIPQFSNGWLEKFKRRHGIVERERARHGEASSVYLPKMHYLVYRQQRRGRVALKSRLFLFLFLILFLFLPLSLPIPITLDAPKFFHQAASTLSQVAFSSCRAIFFPLCRPRHRPCHSCESIGLSVFSC